MCVVRAGMDPTSPDSLLAWGQTSQGQLGVGGIEESCITQPRLDPASAQLCKCMYIHVDVHADVHTFIQK